MNANLIDFLDQPVAENNKKKILLSFENLYRSLVCTCPLLANSEAVESKALEIGEFIWEDYEDEDTKMLQVIYSWLSNLHYECLEFIESLDIKSFNTEIVKSLLGSLPNDVNPDSFSHALDAFKLNQSIRNSYVVASKYRSDKYYDKVKTLKFHEYLFYKRPKGNCAYRHLANTLYERSEFLDAARYFRIAVYQEKNLSIIPEFFNCLIKANNFEEALSLIEYSSKVMENSKLDRLDRIKVLYRIGEFDQAFEFLEYSDLKVTTLSEGKAVPYQPVDSYLIEVYKWKIECINDKFENNKFIEFISNTSELLYRKFIPYELQDKFFTSYLDVYGGCQPINKDNNVYKFFLEGINYSGSDNKKLGLKKNIEKMSLFYLDDNITFGKYSGSNLKLKNLIADDGDYVLWCIINLAFFRVERNALFDLHLSRFPYFTKALEYNEIKHLFHKENINKEKRDYYVQHNHPSYSESLRDALDGQMDAYWNID